MKGEASRSRGGSEGGGSEGVSVARFPFMFIFLSFCFGRQWRCIGLTGFGQSGRGGKECVGAFAVVCEGRKGNKTEVLSL